MLLNICPNSHNVQGFSDGSAGNESACNSGDTGDAGSIPALNWRYHISNMETAKLANASSIWQMKIKRFPIKYKSPEWEQNRGQSSEASEVIWEGFLGIVSFSSVLKEGKNMIWLEELGWGWVVSFQMKVMTNSKLWSWKWTRAATRLSLLVHCSEKPCRQRRRKLRGLWETGH